MIIRECRERDVDLLERHIPSPGSNRYHAARFVHQRQRISTFLIAWVDDVPVGCTEVRWAGCAAPEIHRRFPDCPEVNGLTVWPEERQSRGVGTALLSTAETAAARRGHRRIGLGVDERNSRATALYLRLGYRETGHRYLDRYQYQDDSGIGHHIADPCRYLIKPLSVPANPATS